MRQGRAARARTLARACVLRAAPGCWGASASVHAPAAELCGSPRQEYRGATSPASIHPPTPLPTHPCVRSGGERQRREREPARQRGGQRPGRPVVAGCAGRVGGCRRASTLAMASQVEAIKWIPGARRAAQAHGRQSGCPASRRGLGGMLGVPGPDAGLAPGTARRRRVKQGSCGVWLCRHAAPCPLTCWHAPSLLTTPPHCPPPNPPRHALPGGWLQLCRPLQPAGRDLLPNVGGCGRGVGLGGGVGGVGGGKLVQAYPGVAGRLASSARRLRSRRCAALCALLCPARRASHAWRCSSCAAHPPTQPLPRGPLLWPAALLPGHHLRQRGYRRPAGARLPPQDGARRRRQAGAPAPGRADAGGRRHRHRAARQPLPRRGDAAV